MKTLKKTLSLILALAMVFALAACNGGGTTATNPPDTGASTPAPDPGTDATPDATPAPAGDGKSYTLSYASNNAPGSLRYDILEQGFADLMYEKSGGRITIDIYPSGSLSAPGKTLDGIKNGTVDTGIDSFTRYAGQYPYFEFLTAPGLVYGSPEEFNAVLEGFVANFPDSEMSGYKVIVMCDAGDFGLVSNDAVHTVEDIKGKTVRNTSQFIPLYDLLGASSVSVPSADMYESLKLNTINAANTTLSAIPEFHLEEVCDYFTIVPIERSDFMIVMSQDLYDEFDDELKAAVDAVCEEMKGVALEYLAADNEKALTQLKSNSNFEIIEFSDEEVQKLVDIASELLDARALELDAAGLDGTGALAWMRDHAKVS